MNAQVLVELTNPGRWLFAVPTHSLGLDSEGAEFAEEGLAEIFG